MQTTGGPLARAHLDALWHRTMDAREDGHPHSIITVPPPPIRAPNEGGRRLMEAAHITLTTNREVPCGVPAPLAAAALSAAPVVTFGLFLAVHPHTTVPIHTPNQRLLLNPPNQKRALVIALLEKRQGIFPSALSKVQFCPRYRPHPRFHPKLLRQCPLVLPKCPHGRSQKFFHHLLQ
jgi:hypothetical protein